MLILSMLYICPQINGDFFLSDPQIAKGRQRLAIPSTNDKAIKKVQDSILLFSPTKLSALVNYKN
jgi:hypothetical protein